MDPVFDGCLLRNGCGDRRLFLRLGGSLRQDYIQTPPLTGILESAEAPEKEMRRREDLGCL